MALSYFSNNLRLKALATQAKSAWVTLMECLHDDAVMQTHRADDTDVNNNTCPSSTSEMEQSSVGKSHYSNESDDGPATDSVDDGPATDKHNDGPATDKHNDGPATDKHNDGPATDNQDDGPATDNHDGGPATDNVDDVPATDSHDAAPAMDSHDAAPVTDGADDDVIKDDNLGRDYGPVFQNAPSDTAEQNSTDEATFDSDVTQEFASNSRIATISNNDHIKDVTYNDLPATEHDNVDAFVREYVNRIIKEVYDRDRGKQTDDVPQLTQCCDGSELKQNDDGPVPNDENVNGSEPKEDFDGPEPKEDFDGPGPKYNDDVSEPEPCSDNTKPADDMTPANTTDVLGHEQISVDQEVQRYMREYVLEIIRAAVRMVNDPPATRYDGVIDSCNTKNAPISNASDSIIDVTSVATDELHVNPYNITVKEDTDVFEEIMQHSNADIDTKYDMSTVEEEVPRANIASYVKTIIKTSVDLYQKTANSDTKESTNSTCTDRDGTHNASGITIDNHIGASNVVADKIGELSDILTDNDTMAHTNNSDINVDEPGETGYINNEMIHTPAINNKPVAITREVTNGKKTVHWGPIHEIEADRCYIVSDDDVNEDDVSDDDWDDNVLDGVYLADDVDSDMSDDEVICHLKDEGNDSDSEAVDDDSVDDDSVVDDSVVDDLEKEVASDTDVLYESDEDDDDELGQYDELDED